MTLLRCSLSLFLLSSLVQGQNTNEFDNGSYTVQAKINAKQPRYTYFDKDDPKQHKYRVFFSKIYEKKNGSKVGGSNIALSSMNWVISEDLETESENLVFWINGTMKQNGNANKADRLSLLSFRNEIFNKTFKFDVYLEDYVWQDAEADSLDLEWKMTNSTGNEDQDDGIPENEEERQLRSGVRSLEDDGAASTSDDLICWYGAGGDADNQVCWKIEEEALAFKDDGSNATVPVSLDLDGGFIVVSYKNWGEGNLLHDPEVGHLLETNYEESDSCGFNPFCYIFNFIGWILSLFGF